MTPADRRISELIDKWLTSIDLHLQYVELSDAAYARAQPWPQHDRPTRWVLEVARQKTLELKQHCETRQAMGDSRFAEALELMAFLSNLVGIQAIQRFIPLADPTRDGTGGASATTLESTVIKPVTPKPRPAEDATREMPRLKAPPPAKAAPTPAPVKPAAAKPTPPPVKAQTTKSPPKAETAAKSVAPDMKNKIIADAVRLMKWGKPWHELAELIERIAERPPVGEIRKVLRANRAEIEAKAQK